MEFIDKTPFLRIAKVKTSQGYAGTDREDIGVIPEDESAYELAWDHAINDGDGIPMVCDSCGAEEDCCDCEDATFEEDSNHNIEGYWVALEPEDLGEYASDILDILKSHNIAKEVQGMLQILDRVAFCQAFDFSDTPELWEDVLDQFKERFSKIFDTNSNILAEQKLVPRYIIVTRTITTLEKVHPMTEKEFKDLSRDGDILEYTKTVKQFNDKLNYRVAYGSEIPE